MLTRAVTELWDSLRGSGPATATVAGWRALTCLQRLQNQLVGGKCKRALESGRYCAGQPEIAPN